MHAQPGRKFSRLRRARLNTKTTTGNTFHFQRVQQFGYPLALVNWRMP
jgi:hypothetical protein